MILASTGVIGLWGIGFFSVDLNQAVFRKVYEARQRESGEAEMDRQFIAMLIGAPQEAAALVEKLQPKDLIPEQPGRKDAQQIYDAIAELNAKKTGAVQGKHPLAGREKIPLARCPGPRPRKRLNTYLTPSPETSNLGLQQQVDRITARAKKINRDVIFWAGMTSMLFNIGGFFGAYGFSYLTSWLGRRWAFAVSFLLAGISTCVAFLYMSTAADVFWMTPLMGGCIFLIFGGYAVYFPELYPTRLRSTGTSFCYNIGRYVAAIGPITLGLLSSKVFVNHPEPMRYAGAAMCAIFLVGLIALPFAPETKGQPLPE